MFRRVFFSAAVGVAVVDWKFRWEEISNVNKMLIMLIKFRRENSILICGINILIAYGWMLSLWWRFHAK